MNRFNRKVPVRCVACSGSATRLRLESVRNEGRISSSCSTVFGNYGEAYLRYGQLPARLNSREQAFNSLSRAVELLPKSEEAKAELGRLAMIDLLHDARRPQRVYRTADKMATELLAANPYSAEGLRLKGYLALVDSRPNAVIDYFRRSLLAKPNQPDIVTMPVQTLLPGHRGDEAEKVARSALATLKNDGPLYDTLYGSYMGPIAPRTASNCSS